MIEDAALVDLLDRHAQLLAAGDPAAAEMARNAPAELRSLLAVATAAHAALPPVAPAPAFRDALGRGLVHNAARPQARHRRAAAGLKRLPGLASHRSAVVTSGAAMAVMGVTVAWLAGRKARTAAG
jgi:hypothetical protein